MIHGTVRVGKSPWLLVAMTFAFAFVAKTEIADAATYRYRRTPPVKPLPPLKWEPLEAGLVKAKSTNKPAVVVFTTSDFKGPGTFETQALREALTKSGAIPIRVLPPAVPRLSPNTSADEISRVQKSYDEALKQYQETTRQYGVNGTNPSLAFSEPGGTVLWTAQAPGHDDMLRYIAGMPQAIRNHEAEKARAKASASEPVSKR